MTDATDRAGSTAPMPRLDLGLADLAPSYDLVLCDVWGVIHNGVSAHLAAVEALRKFRAGGGSVILVTNAPVPRAHVARRCARLGIATDCYDEIATSGDVTVELIVAAGCPPLHAIGPTDETILYEEAARLGPRAPERVAIDRAELAICVGLDEARDTPAAYDASLRALRDRDLDLVCANPDLVVEVGETLVYCAGAIAERYAAIGGRVVQAGKPFPAIYARAMAMATVVRGATPQHRVLAIGDAMRTDVNGACAQGYDALFVTSGIHRDAIHRGDRRSPVDPDALGRFLSEFEARPMAAIANLAWRLDES